jgi:hypothetical protein
MNGQFHSIKMHGINNAKYLLPLWIRFKNLPFLSSSAFIEEHKTSLRVKFLNGGAGSICSALILLHYKEGK